MGTRTSIWAAGAALVTVLGSTLIFSPAAGASSPADQGVTAKTIAGSCSLDGGRRRRGIRGDFLPGHLGRIVHDRLGYRAGVSRQDHIHGALRIIFGSHAAS